MQIFQFSSIALLLVAFVAQSNAFNADKMAKEVRDVQRAKKGVKSAKAKLNNFNTGRAARWAQLKKSGLSQDQLNSVHQLNEKLEGGLEQNMYQKQAQYAKEKTDVYKSL